MPKLLTKLRITEVSAVDKGAGDGTRIVLMKRDDPPHSKPHIERAARRLRKFSFNAVLARLEAEAMAKADAADGDETDRDEGGTASDHHISRLADLVAEGSGGKVDRAAALGWLLHHRDGIAMARMHKADNQTAKELSPMTSHSEFVQSVVKQYGVVALAKSMVKEQKAYGLDEHEFTQLATEHARRIYTNDRPDAAFSKLYQSEESVRRACQVAKAQTLEPVMVGGVAATHEAINNTEQSEAYAQLEAMASKLRASSPWLSAEQAFAKVFEDPKHAKLASAAHRRPTAPADGIYPYPR